MGEVIVFPNTKPLSMEDEFSLRTLVNRITAAGKFISATDLHTTMGKWILFRSGGRIVREIPAFLFTRIGRFLSLSQL
ncbi:hypothetical protein CH375_01860 [Leptospira ellisii]|nr:hypothetical protein CH379_09555 [Leptospira ellisii]PKA06043.1 hypothetical protein CH375_01860 [Leptospira ellisii]